MRNVGPIRATPGPVHGQTTMIKNLDFFAALVQQVVAAVDDPASGETACIDTPDAAAS